MGNVVGVILFLAVYALAHYYGRYIAFAEQWPIYEALRTTASIIFGVMGAWLAVVYPDVLSRLVSKEQKNKRAEIYKVKKIIEPLIFSTFCVIVVLFVGILTPIMKQIPVVQAHVQFVRGLSFGLVACLTTYMAWTLLKVLVPGQDVKQELEALQKKQDALSKLQSRIGEK